MIAADAALAPIRSPYAPQREVEDLDALIGEAGGSAHVLGLSSGAGLRARGGRSERARNRKAGGVRAPLHDFTCRLRAPCEGGARCQLARLIAAGRRGDAVKYFMRI